MRPFICAPICFLATIPGLVEATPVLYGMSVDRQQLVTVDVHTGVVTDHGSPIACVEDIAFNTDDGMLYGYECEIQTSLIRIDPASTTWERVGIPFNTTRMHGMAYDPVRERVFATNLSGILFSVDPATGDISIVGNLGETIASLAYDPMTDSLFGVTWWGEFDLYRIDPDTAELTLIGDMGAHGTVLEGLAFDPDSRQLYGVFVRSPYEDSVLATIDPLTAAVTEIGPIGSDDFISGLAFAPEPSGLALLILGTACAVRRRRMAA